MAKRVLKTTTLQKQTGKRFPNCKAVQDEYGLWYIMDKSGEDTFEEFFLPHQNTEREAWEVGKLTAQMIQNFNRTHPLKDNGSAMDKIAKKERISRRKNNSHMNDSSTLF